ncbi:MAG: tRNA pseudouridine(38-40) synthase TruA [Chloroflexota bacterium]
MARYQVVVAYDGTEFQGFQRQDSSRTVQAEVEVALRKLDWQGVTILAAGRTDTGVHALGQVIAFDLEWKHSSTDLREALNAHLPKDVAVQHVCSTEADFHPRYDAISRQYQYYLYCSAVRSPFWERYSWRVAPPLEFDLLRQSAAALIGEHDFASFGKPPKADSSTVRTVHKACWQQQGKVWIFTITANAFLYHMVRHLVYFQVAIGQGRVMFKELTCALEKLYTPEIQGLAPPQGLFLVKVSYPAELECQDEERRKGQAGFPLP